MTVEKENFATLTQSDIWVGSDLVVMARIQDAAGVNLTRAATASIVMRGYNRNLIDPSIEQFNDLGIAVTSTIFDTLVTTDPLWPASFDTVGYNFKYTIAGAKFNAATLWRVVFTITPVTGTALSLVSEATSQEVIPTTQQSSN